MMLLPVTVVLLAAGVLSIWLAGSVAGHLAGVLITLLASVLLGVGYGLLRSARADEHERRLDEAIRQATGPCGTDCGTTGCGDSACTETDCAVKALRRG